MQKKYTRVRFACYTVSVMMAIVANLPPILFLTFRSLYGISFSQMGLLILINYMTQLGVDLIFSFLPHKFDVHKAVKSTPYLMFCGILIFASVPPLFPSNAFVGLALATVIFSAAAGLGEVLVSPLIAALPAKDPDREMSKLHSVYAWGTVFVVVFGTVFIHIIGAGNWQWLMLATLAVPIISMILFWGVKLPEMQTNSAGQGSRNLFRQKWLWLCCITIFLGGASELTMAQWCSGYLEQALGIPKVWGDMFGVALFSAMLGLGRTLYAKIGRNIGRILFLGNVGAAICYFLTAATDSALLGLFACAFTVFCTSMLWPGNLVIAADRFPTGGVFLFAFMAAAGDMGASVGPQLVGVITDITIASDKAADLAAVWNITVEQLGLKLGMLSGMLFPLFAIPLSYCIMRSQNKEIAK